MKLQEFIVEAVDRSQIKTVERELKRLGYESVSVVSPTLITFTSTKDRRRILNMLVHQFEGATRINSTQFSDLGHVRFGNINIVVTKPFQTWGVGGAGIANEHVVIDTITHCIREVQDTITVVFQSTDSSFTCDQVLKVENLSRNTIGRRKADFMLITMDGREVHFSLKKDNAGFWESPDAFFKDKATTLIQRLVKRRSIQLTQDPDTGAFHIHPNVAIRATPKEEHEMVFGADIFGNGAVLIKTFTNSDFRWNAKKKLLQIRVSHIITSVEDIPEDKQVWFRIFNSVGRTIGSYKGLRVVAVQRSKISNQDLKVT